MLKFRDMTPAQRESHRAFWLAWVTHAQTTIGSLLAATIDETPSISDTVYECVNQLIDVEQQLSTILEPATPRWTRRASGHWSSGCGYDVRRQSHLHQWRVIREGKCIDVVDTLPEAKRSVDRDLSKRIARGATQAETEE